MSELRFAMLGTGFWSKYQLAGWREVPGVKCVALYNRTRSKAEKLASEFGVATVYDDAEGLLRSESLDFIDIVTDVDTHARFVALGAEQGLPVICQKPMAPSLEIARRMVEQTDAAGVPLLIHENWRWQTPLRKLKSILESGQLGQLVRARIDYANSFPVFDHQPFLKELTQFLLTDIGTHILDVSRFLFGEATELYCQTRRMKPDIAGEDVATVMLRTHEGLTVTCNMSYASRWEYDRFPETFVAVEGTSGGVSLGADYEITVFDKDGSHRVRAAPHGYSWSDPAYALVHSSIVDCHRNLVGSLRGDGEAETTGEDNLRTLELVFGAYESAENHCVVKIG
jgi:predicted dehydrogenase